MMGSFYSRKTTEKILENGTSVDSFPLQYDTYYACAINLGTTVVITGGSASKRLVGEYNEDGFIKYLPPLQGEGRYTHGCSYYKNNEGFKTLLVAGGSDGSNYPRTTEILVGTHSGWASEWVFTGSFNSNDLMYVRGVNMNNKIYMTGGRLYYSNTNHATYDQIFEFEPPSDPSNPMTGNWKTV